MLNVVSIESANEIIKNHISPNNTVEYVDLKNAPGRILAQDIISNEDVPSFNRSTVDGYAVISSDTFGCSEAIPAMLDIVGEIYMGEEADIDIKNNQCVKISTGGMLPKSADAVVMLEYTENELDNLCLCTKAVSPFENVVCKGADVSKNDVLIKKDTIISASQIGILSALGIYNVAVKKTTTVGIISTGDELVEASKELPIGKIRDINTYLLNSCCKSINCNTILYGIIKDDYSSILEALKKASEECDVVLISGGSSAGTKDVTVNVINELGESYFHGVAMKPGKPSIFGAVNNKAVFGLPGHPLAAFFVFEKLVKYAVSRMNNTEYPLHQAERKISANISSNNGREDFVCVKIIDDEFAEPILAKSGIISVLNNADGYITIPRNAEGVKANEKVRIILL